MAFPQLHHTVTHWNILTHSIVLHKNVSRSSDKQAYHRCSLWMLLGKKLPQNSKKFFFPLVPGWSFSLSVSLDGNKEGFSRSVNLEATILNSPGLGCQCQIQKVLPPFVLECTPPLKGTQFQRYFWVTLPQVPSGFAVEGDIKVWAWSSSETWSRKCLRTFGKWALW